MNLQNNLNYQCLSQNESDDKSNTIVLVKAITWRRDSHGLFD